MFLQLIHFNLMPTHAPHTHSLALASSDSHYMLTVIKCVWPFTYLLFVAGTMDGWSYKYKVIMMIKEETDECKLQTADRWRRVTIYR